jgi:hypothetical protein
VSALAVGDRVAIRSGAYLLRTGRISLVGRTGRVEHFHARLIEVRLDRPDGDGPAVVVVGRSDLVRLDDEVPA